MNPTHIQWTDATWNPVTGCTKVSAGCKNCYAERVFPRAYGNSIVTEWSGDDNPATRPRRFTDVVCHEDRLEQPLHMKKPRRIFVNSMSDLFHEDVPFEFIDKVFAVMALCPQHTFQILTKRPERMRQWFRPVGQVVRGDFVRMPMYKIRDTIDSTKLPPYVWPLPNVWLGVSAEDQKTADERIPLLLQTPAAVRFISYEPALGPVKLFSAWTASMLPPHLNWVIAGSESGPNARDYETEWFANIARQCQDDEVAFFMKQLTVRGKPIPYEEFPGYLQVRQFPVDK